MIFSKCYITEPVFVKELAKSYGLVVKVELLVAYPFEILGWLGPYHS